MKKPLTLSVALVVSAAGFAAASIVAGGSLAAVTRELTHGMWTTRTNLDTETTSTTVGGRGVVICHRRGHHGSKTIVVDEHAVGAHLRHGDTIGYCTTGGSGKGHGFGRGHGHSGGDDDASGTTTTSGTTSISGSTTTDSGNPAGGIGFGHGHHGHHGDGQGDDGANGSGTTTSFATSTSSGFTGAQSGGSSGSGSDSGDD
jgi:hypothetical protein